MKITCQSCQAKYTIADEKVAGKTVKIKCKKCGATIVVSGSDAAAAAPLGAPSAMGPSVSAGAPPGGDDDEGDGATRVFSEGGGGGGGNEEWTVNVTDEDQRTLSAAQIVQEFQRGVVTNDTYVWKDGMTDWLPLSDVPELSRMVAIAAPRPAAGASAPAYTPAPQPSAQISQPARPAPAPAPMGGDASPFGGTMIMGEQAAAAPVSPALSPAAAAAAPAAARRTGKGGGVDLFQQRAEAAPATSASTATTSADRMVGERNENSVLFSISALTAAAGVNNKKNDDPFDLGGSSSPRNGGRANVDDIMNLGGGMSGPMLAPPPLMAPVVEAPPPPPQPVVQQQVAYAAPPMSVGAPMSMGQPYPQPKSKTPLVLGIVAGVALLGGAGVFFATRGPATPTGGAESTTAATATATPTVAATQATPTPTATPTPVGDAPKPADTGNTVAAVPQNTGPATPANPGKPAVGGPLPGKVDKAEPAKAEPKAEPAKAEPAKAEPAKAEPAKADPGNAGGGKEFDRGAALAALSAAAGAARGCKKDDGPTGTARVKVTFSPNGSVASASVDGPPFAGTSVGGCIAAAFRGAHIPAYDGPPQPVSKSVSIN